MAKKEALRELQSRLAERPAGGTDAAARQSWLAVECSGRGFLFPLQRGRRDLCQSAPMVPVPHTHPWFLGVANLRGHLHGVVDLAGFLGVKTGESVRANSRALVGFNQTLDLNCALLVDRLAGLRSEEQLRRETDDSSPSPPSSVALSRCGRPAVARTEPGRRWPATRLS